MVIIQLHRFTFLKSPELRKLNISYLHDFNQYFVENLGIKMSNFLESAKVYSILFQLFDFNDKMETLFAEALSLMKIL